MMTLQKPVAELTAADVMTQPVEAIPESMSLREAAQLLSRHQVSGAPVVDAGGRCVGVLSAVDVVRWAESQADLAASVVRLPRTCAYSAPIPSPEGKDAYRCLLPDGACPVQVKKEGPEGNTLVLCQMPHCVLVDWQQVAVEELPTDEVGRYMTRDVVTASPGTPVAALARMMVDGHLHRVIVVDDLGGLKGVVSSTDLLAVLAGMEPA